MNAVRENSAPIFVSFVISPSPLRLRDCYRRYEVSAANPTPLPRRLNAGDEPGGGYAGPDAARSGLGGEQVVRDRAGARRGELRDRGGRHGPAQLERRRQDDVAQALHGPDRP